MRQNSIEPPAGEQSPFGFLAFNIQTSRTIHPTNAPKPAATQL
jgi:hypothetical protein